MTANLIQASKDFVHRIFKKQHAFAVILLISFCFTYSFSNGGTKHIENIFTNDRDSVVISGIIKDENGNAIENASIVFDSTEVATTGKDGKFLYEPEEITRASHNIYFTADGYITVIRSYNRVMGSSNYNLILRKQTGNASTQASIKVVRVIKKDTLTAETQNGSSAVKDTVATAIKDTTTISVKANAAPGETAEVLDFPSILFKPNITGLSGQDKAFLEIIAAKLKENPAMNIDIKAYTHQNDTNPVITQTRLANIINYLKKTGISASRLKKVIIPKGGDENTIDVVVSKK